MESAIPLSEAVVLGFLEGVQPTNHDWVRFGGDGRVCAGCLVGSAFRAVGITANSHSGWSEEDMENLWPWLKQVKFIPPDRTRVEDWSYWMTWMMRRYLERAMTLDAIQEAVRAEEAKYASQLQVAVVDEWAEVL